MGTQHVVWGHHHGLSDLVADALSLIDLRDDLDDDVGVDNMDLLEILLTNLPARDIAQSLPDFYQAVRHINQELMGYDLRDLIFSEQTVRVEIHGDQYYVYLEGVTCH